MKSADKARDLLHRSEIIKIKRLTPLAEPDQRKNIVDDPRRGAVLAVNQSGDSVGKFFHLGGDYRKSGNRPRLDILYFLFQQFERCRLYLAVEAHIPEPFRNILDILNK